MKKTYSACVVKELDNYFTGELQKRPVEVISRTTVTNGKGEPILYFYVLEAEEGIIDPKFEIGL